MDEKRHNRILYWAMATVPFAGLWLVGQVYGSFWFISFLLFYLFIYRPTLDTRRLLSLNVIEEKDAWRFFVPLAVNRFQYQKALWLG